MNARSCRDYKVGWICALPKELAASICMLDEKHSPPSDSPQNDPNNYSYGTMKGHDVVLACLPKGIIGETAAAIAAERMRSTFSSIKFALLVGIGGGIPSPMSDIRLGDVVVSVPANEHPGVIQYDMGKTGRDGKFIRTGSLNRPPDILLNAVATLESRHLYQDTEVYDYVLEMLEKFKRMEKGSCHQGVENDQLFKLEFEHVENEEDCAACLEDQEALVPRQMRESNVPNIFYGLIASGNQVIKHGATRDRFRKELKVLCFEMEAAGVLNVFPCLVIRGICDYADSHKNKRWQGYAAATAAAYAKELLCVIPPGRVLHTSSGGETIRQSMTIMPLARDPKFVGRELALNQIEQVHSQNRVLRRVAVIGLGGVGKTAIAIEYAYRCKDVDPELSLLWVHASSAARFLESYISIAERLKLPGWNDSKVDKLRLVHRWLASEESGKWLLILDNLDDAGLVTGSDARSESIATQTFTLPQYLPQNGSIVITSRYKGAALPLLNNESSCVVRLGVMESAEAVRLLQSRLGTEDNTQAELEGLAEELEYIPLAVAQASAYIAQSEMTSVVTYLSDLRSGQDEQSNLLSTIWVDLRRDADTSSDGDEGMNAVIRTWQTSFRQIEIRNPLAADLLGRMSMFDRQNIPSWILFDGDADARECREALDLLLGFSFIARQTNKTSFDMHRLVQLAMKTWLRMRSCYVEQRESALCTLNKAYPTGSTYRNWPTCATLEPHVDTILLDEDISPSASLDRASLLLERAYYSMYALSGFSQAVAYVEEVVAIRERHLGESHIDNLNALHLQCEALVFLGHYTAAIDAGRKSAAGLERALGAKHEDTLIAKLELSSAMSSAGQHVDAIVLQREGLASSIGLNGPEHENSMKWKHLLSESLMRQGSLEEAELLAKQVIETKLRIFGKDDPEMLCSMHNLAMVYMEQSRLEEAVSMLSPLLETSKRVRGPAHHDTLTTMHYLSFVFARMDRLEDAESLLQQTLEIQKVVLGLEHMSTFSSMSLLASIWWSRKHEHEAIQLMRETLELSVKVHGVDHNATKFCGERLSYCLESVTFSNADDQRKSLSISEGEVNSEFMGTPVSAPDGGESDCPQPLRRSKRRKLRP